MSINNQGTASLGRTQAEADFSAFDILREGERMKLTYAAPTDPARFQVLEQTFKSLLAIFGLLLIHEDGLKFTHRAAVAVGEHDREDLFAAHLRAGEFGKTPFGL